MLPISVLEKAAGEMMCYEDSGMSVMEMSHRSPVYDKIIKDAEALLREIMEIPDNYKVLFLQGGASTQFAAVPLNLMKTGKADYILSGQFSTKAYKEAQKYGDAKAVASSKDVEKIINRDNNIVLAVQEYLRMEPQKKDVDETSWMYPLVMIKDKNKSLFDYSNAKLIRKYFHWDNNIPTGIYLYKTSQWKKDQCILLQCEDEKVKESLKKRNQFIISKLNSNEGYKLAMDEEDKHSVDDTYKHLGRSIILKNNSGILYCGVNGYWLENDKEQRSYITECTN